jgi:glycerophosphoryl diester phosphodiesterase
MTALLLVACFCKLVTAKAPAAGPDADVWVPAMKKVHAKFRGTRGTFALFGDSITVSKAFWSGLRYAGEDTDPDMADALDLVKGYMLEDCWDRRGPEYGNQGRMTIRWAHQNVERWLANLKPEVALIMFGTNDLGVLEVDEYSAKTRQVVKQCLDKGTIVILSTIPPRHSQAEKAAVFAAAVRKIAREMQVPLTDYHAEILARRPDDWDGARQEFSQYEGYDVPTLISRDGVHPSNPRRYAQDYSPEGLRHNGYVLRSYLALMKYAEVIEEVLSEADAAGPSDSRQGPLPTSRLHTLDLRTAQDLRALFHQTDQSMPLVSAHRGGAKPGYPENCIATFENTLRHTYAIMEIDPRYTKDRQIVLHHDATLERTTTGRGCVTERTLQDLRKLRLKDPDGAATEHKVPTLDEVLQWARGKTVVVLDQKDVPVAARVRKIEEHGAEAYAMLIVYSYRDARTCYELNKDIMMEVMIPDRSKFEEFDKTGVPWKNIVAFVGHTPPQDMQLIRMIRAKGTCCMVGTSRNLDRQLAASQSGNTTKVVHDYLVLLETGADLIETDLPREVARLLYQDTVLPASKSRLFRIRSMPGQP